MIPFCLWQIWVTRNSNCFNDKRESIPCKNAIAKVVEFIRVAGGCTVIPDLVIGIKWHPPKRGTYKLNIDSATLQKELIRGLKRSN